MTSPRLRILFVTEDDPLYVVLFFEVFFAEYPREDFEIAGITIDQAFHEPLVQTARRILGLYGPVGFVRLGLRYVSRKLSGRTIERLARRHGVPRLHTASVNDPEFVARARELEPDVIVSVAAPEIFRRAILEVPRLGCVNIHSGRLPKYRGMLPNFWQLLNGETHATVTVHRMVPKLDMGDVLATLEVPLEERDTLHRVITVTKQEGARLMIRTLGQIAAGTTSPRPLAAGDADYFSFPGKDDVRAFRRRGHRLLA